MGPTGLSPLAGLLLVALACVGMLSRWSGAPSAAGRFATIDGLRGYLAFAVFLHHACAWYFYLRTGRWDLPPSRVYVHLGQSSVVLFFMITGFLFSLKLIDGSHRGVDWLKLYVSRVMRLTPLYLVAVAALFLVVAALSEGQLRVPVASLIKQALFWLAFTIPGTVDLNATPDTCLALACVTWSLRVEWLFYLFLPALALCLGVVPPTLALLLAAVSVALAWQLGLPLAALAPFGSGLLAAALTKVPRMCALARHWGASVAATLGLLATMAYFPTPHAVVPLALLTLVFVLIACGTDLFGVLRRRVSRLFGELAYSLYLLHGLVLFVSFRFVLDRTWAAEISSVTHWLVIAALTPVLIGTCFATFHWIERPGMAATDAVTAWIRRHLPRTAIVPKRPA